MLLVLKVMVLTLPDHIPALHRMSEQEMKRELALGLYAARKFTIIRAADLAQANCFDFQTLLRDRKIPRHYDDADLEQDLATLRELPPR